MVIIILVICITRFYFDVSKDTGKNISSPVIYSRSEQPVNGMYIFEDENGLSGVIDENSSIILEPQWHSIEIMNNGFFIVSGMFGDDILYGCVDSEGNVTVPFIYSGFEKFGTDNMMFYVGKISGENSCIVYDNRFLPCLGRVWDSFDISGNKLNLYYNENIYSYFAGDDGISLKSTIIKNRAVKKKYSISFSSRVLLSKLDYRSLEKISDCISAYLDYSFTGNYSLLEPYVQQENQQNFSEFFYRYPEIDSKRLRAVKDISVYQEKLDDGTQCITASVKISAGISYPDGDENINLKDIYCAEVRFSEKEFGTVDMLSAYFLDDDIPEDNTEYEKNPDFPEN